jgi:hypothetical protein
MTIVVVLVMRPHGRQLPPPRARVYRDVSVCLLTGSTGLADPLATAVWSGMEDASTATLIRVSYVAVAGPDTVANALPYAASLVQRRCTIIVAVGAAEVSATAQQAGQQVGIRFVLVGDGSASSNVSAVTDKQPERVRVAVSNRIRTAVGG